jgi:hypothetical protein
MRNCSAIDLGDGKLLNDHRPSPSVSKGKNFPFQTAVVAWIDLLGYGEMISNAGFNPLHPSSAAAKKRLSEFHRVVAAHSGRKFPSLVINDGAVVYRDLSYRSASVTFDFLQRSWNLFNEINQSEGNSSYPGARMVIAAGFRIRGRRAGMDATAEHFESIMTRYADGTISVIQAIQEARRIRPSFDIVPQLQANFAFTKAYVAEQSGTKGGLAGSRCFIDLSLFEQTLPTCFGFDKPIDWQNDKLGLKARFAPLLGLSSLKQVEKSNGAPLGVSDGLQVAQRLAGDENVLKVLRSYGGTSIRK